MKSAYAATRLRASDGRRCSACGAVLVRRVGEAVADFRKRGTCTAKCEGATRIQRRQRPTTRSYCSHCHQTIRRRRSTVTADGLEPYDTYINRKYCGMECEMAAHRRANETEVLPSPSQSPVRQRVQVKPTELSNSVGSLKKLARAYTVEAVNALVKVTRTGSDNAKVAAANALLDRGWGKATQNTNISVRKIQEMDEQELMYMLGLTEDDVGEIVDAEYTDLSFPGEDQLPEPNFDED